MKRLLKFLTIVFLILAVCNPLIIGITNANAQFIVSQLPFIYIKTDGSIDPQTVPIQRNGNTYGFISDISGYQICIQRDDIILDGKGFALECNPYCGAITLEPKSNYVGRQNVVIQNLKVIESYQAVYGPWIENCTFQSNVFQDCFGGLNISPSASNVIITNNTFIGKGLGIWLWGSSNSICGNQFQNHRLAIEVFDGENNKISDNLFVNVGSDIQIDNAMHTLESNNSKITGPLPTSPPPTKIALSAEQVYNSSSIPLVFNINQNYSWVAYSLDNLANVTVAGNTTLTELSNGNHSLVVYANGTLGGMGKSEAINFTVAVPFPITLALVPVVISAVLMSVGLLIYLKMRKKLTSKQSFL